MNWNWQTVLGVTLAALGFGGFLVLCWQWGTPKREKRAETPADLVDAATARRRVQSNAAIARGRLDEQNRRAS